MDKTTLLPLLAARHLTVESLRTTDPNLADRVLALVREADAAQLLSALRDLPEDVRIKVAAIDLTAAEGNVVDYLQARLPDLGLPYNLVSDVVRRTRRVRLGPPLDPSQPISAHPVVAAQLAKATIYEIGALAKLPDSAAKALAEAAPAPSALDDATLKKLVADKKLTAVQAQDVGFSSTLHALVGEDAALTTAILTASSFPRLSNKPPASTADLAKLSASDWTAFFTSDTVPLPEATTPQAMASALAGRFAALHPGVALTGRLPQPDAARIVTSLDDLAPLLAKNPNALASPFADIDTTGLDASQIAKLQTTHATLTQLARAYPGLDLASVLGDPKLTPEAKATTVARRTGLVQKVTEHLGDTFVLHLDLSAVGGDVPSKLGLDKLDATALEQGMVVSMFKTHQRLSVATNDIDDMHTLVAAGYTSLQDFAGQPLAEFIMQSGFDEAKARGMRAQAQATAIEVATIAAAMIDRVGGTKHANSNEPHLSVEYLKRLPGYEALFGNLSFCDCEECRSILGPAAYFVDLLTYIDADRVVQTVDAATGRYVHQPTRAYFDAPGRDRHPLDLKVRRPDLWSLELSCDNTNFRVPTLELVDEILENYIARRLRPTISLTPRTAIDTLVYQTELSREITQPPPTRTGVIESFRQPFHLPLARIGSYLPKLGHTRAEVVDAVGTPLPVLPSVPVLPSGSVLPFISGLRPAPVRGAPSIAWAQAELGLSAREFDVVTTRNATLGYLRKVYDLAFGGVDDAVKPIEPQQLGPAMGLTRDELAQLVVTRFVRAGGAQPTIVGAKRNATTSVQVDAEWVQGLTADALDAMHRFTRLARKTRWSIPELDLVLRALGDSSLAASSGLGVPHGGRVGGPGIQGVAALHAIQARLGITVAEACALVGAIPKSPAGQSLMDRLFNMPPFNTDRAFPKPEILFLHPAFRHGAPALPDADQALPRLLRGLSVDLGGLEALARNLVRELSPGFMPGVSGDDLRSFALSEANLTLLYRHALMARLLGLSIDDLFQLLRLADRELVGVDHIAGLTEVLVLLDVHAWWRKSGYSLDDVAAATGRAPREAADAAMAERARAARELALTNLVDKVKESAAKALTFTGTVFAVELGKTEQESRDLLTSLAKTPGVVETPPDGTWRLKAGIDLATMPILPRGTRPAEDLRSVLYSTIATFTEAWLASALGTSAAGARALLTSISPAVVENVSGTTWRFNPGIRLEALRIGPWTVPTLPLHPSATRSVTQIELLGLLRTYAVPLVFTDDTRPHDPGTPAPLTHDLLQKNPDVVETPPNGTWRLKLGIDLEAVTDAAVRGVLRPYLASEVLARSLGAALGFAADKVKALAALVGQSLTDDAVLRAMRGDGQIDPLRALVAKLQPLTAAFAAPVWDAAAIDFVRLGTPRPDGHSHPQAFSVGDESLPHAVVDPGHPNQPNVPFVSLAQLRALSTYARLGAGQQGVAREVTAARQVDLREVLAAFDPALLGFPSSSDAAMARVLGVPTGLVAGLRGRITLPAVAADALDQLDRASQLATALGVDGATLAALVSDDYVTLSHAADALVTALGARHADDAARAAALDQAEQPVREARRDALADYLIHSVKDSANQAIWRTIDELYEHFLIDVEAGGCSTTSRVVAATMSAQLYVYRAIMNLEQDRRSADDPDHIALHLPAEAAKEWAWRKNYRVWQANRKVFLWPENYLEPDLRDDKTPLFEELEQELLQTDITEENVADAYAKYLTGFEEIGKLTVAGAYHDRPTQPATGDVFYLFGVTAGDPPTYYYRCCENLIASGRPPYSAAAVWSPWQKINVQITGRKVSPVVHMGRLHVFWIDIRTQPLNELKGGASKFVGYQHTMSLKFTSLRPDKTWTAPQEIQLPDVASAVLPNAGSLSNEDIKRILEGGGRSDSEGGIPGGPFSRGRPNNATFGPGRGQVTDSLMVPESILNSVVTDLRKTFEQELGDAQNTLNARNTALTKTAEEAIATAVFGGGPAALLPIAGAVIGRDEATTAVETARKDLDAARERAGAFLISQRIAVLDPKDRLQKEALDDYTLSGPNWDWGWLESVPQSPPAPPKLTINFRDFREYAELDLFGRKATSIWASFRRVRNPPQLLQVSGSGDRSLRSGTTSNMSLPRPGFANLVVDDERISAYKLEEPDFTGALRWSPDPIATISGDARLTALAVPGSEEDVVLQLGNDILLLQGSVTDDASYVLQRLGTTAADRIARSLFEEKKLNVLLSTDKQLNTDGKGFAEAVQPIRIAQGIVDRSNASPGQLDLAGAHGVYYRELFVHIPFLIANALNSRGDFEAAQRWYHYIFDPTSSEQIPVAGLHAEEVPHRLLDRVWRYREFRGQTIEGLRAMLTDVNAIALYKTHPFNPWAIARTRTTAFQKAIVMKYVDNLLDWADSLFTQFTMESVNEALMLYIMASDVLGPRPAKLGDCGTGAQTVTYGNIVALLGPNDTKEFLRELETYIQGTRVAKAPSNTADSKPAKLMADSASLDQAVWRFPRSYLPRAAAPVKNVPGDPSEGKGKHAAGVIRQIALAFCVPANDEFLAYWDRVQDRLYKIRHCLDIDGKRHDLALFAPPIDPRELIAMTAAGLSLDDVLGESNGNLPPYRFLYLIERAKAFAANLSGFGSALLSALEKKDGEYLNRLRLTQQMNLTQQTRQVRQLEIDAASESLEAVKQQREAAKCRVDFYARLISEDRNGWEVAESIARHTASSIKILEGALGLVAAVTTLLPDAGSPFAMKYGGIAVGGSMWRFAVTTGALAEVSEGVASSASLEANFARRLEGWKNQKELADLDVKSLDRQIKAASIRLDIANRSLQLHDKSLEQLQLVLDRTDDKFTNLGLYTWLSTEMQRLHRGAYQNALGLAKLAEQAYRFERGDDDPPRLAASYWSREHAGLLAGEQLLIGLQTLERRFLETNYRTIEVDQAFALSQVDPRALIDLRETGECNFTVSEVFFDLAYPGHYKRRIKAVRLTIPCITGPYVNVSATLTLTASSIRPTAAVGARPVPVPPNRSVSIATSTAQNDAGVFELSFRDERYMPFEGLGAISGWHLTLPKSFRQFDYQTINDVILSISYTAEQDGVLRERVEAQNADLEGSIVKYFSDTRNPPACRLFSLRQDFSSAFTQLLRSPRRRQVTIDLNDRNLPLFARGRRVTVSKAVLLLRTAPGKKLIDDTSSTAFSITIGGLPCADLSTALPSLLPSLGDAFSPNGSGTYALMIEEAGGLAPASPRPPGEVSAIDPASLLDILLYLEYRFG